MSNPWFFLSGNWRADHQYQSRVQVTGAIGCKRTSLNDLRWPLPNDDRVSCGRFLITSECRRTREKIGAAAGAIHVFYGRLSPVPGVVSHRCCSLVTAHLSARCVAMFQNMFQIRAASDQADLQIVATRPDTLQLASSLSVKHWVISVVEALKLVCEKRFPSIFPFCETSYILSRSSTCFTFRSPMRMRRRAISALLSRAASANRFSRSKSARSSRVAT